MQYAITVEYNGDYCSVLPLTRQYYYIRSDLTRKADRDSTMSPGVRIYVDRHLQINGKLFQYSHGFG